jgi:alpha-L-rhamnosidase
MKTHRIRFEHLTPPLGIGTGTPRISWQVPAAPTGWAQLGYDIEVHRLDGPGAGPAVHHVDSAEQVLVPWPGPALPSRTRAAVRVRVHGRTDPDQGPVAGPWSEPAVVETGLLDRADWSARLVRPEPDAAGPTPRPAMLLRTEIVLREVPVRARWYVTAEGVYRGEINGRRVGDEELAPGWTSYHHRLRYRTHDVTDLLVAGRNALGAFLADGWYRGYVGFEGGVRNHYGPRTGLLAQLEVHYGDGSTEVFGTDRTWRSTCSPIVSTGLYEGETFDGRRGRDGWSRVGHDVSDWGTVGTADIDAGRLVAPSGPPVRCTEELPVREVITSPAGATILDFGQNIAGRLRIRVHGRPGDVVTLRHAEVLEHGELGTRPLRGAAATDTFIVGVAGQQVWEPMFTLHGFRYAQVDGWPGTLDPADVTARVIHTDLEPTGTWRSSDPRLDRLHDNIRWGLRGNFVDIPTDCPQRDERLGWTGDIAVFAPTAAFLYECTGFLSSWLADLAAEQTELGTVPNYVPFVPLSFPALPFALWGDAAVTVPWDLHRATGDRELLRRQYDSMLRWVEQVELRAGPGRIWAADPQLGDWLDPSAPPDRPTQASTAPELVATAYFARSARLLAGVAELLGEHKTAQRMAELAEEIRAGFAAEFITPAGRLLSDSQTAYTLAICFDLFDTAGQRTRAGSRLAEIVAGGGFHIGTGFAGTALICDALAATGHLDTAYHLLLTETCPSWLYQVSMGATTLWERWDSMLPDGSINPGDMTSFNHYAYGAVADFLHRVVGGLAPTGPGYRSFAVAPRPGGGLRHCSTRHETPYGPARVDWQRLDGRLEVTVEVPVGSTAVITLPGPDGGPGPQPPRRVGPGRHTVSTPYRSADDDPARPSHVDRLGAAPPP